MKKFLALLKWLHRKIRPKKKIAQKNQFSQFIDLETIFEGQGTPIFFCFANIRCLEVLKKVSGHTSIKWLRYHHFKRRGKTEKCQKWSFLVMDICERSKK